MPQKLAAVIAALGCVDLVTWFEADTPLELILAAFVAFAMALCHRSFSATQYALLSSLTLLIGTLGRGALGQMIEHAPVKFLRKQRRNAADPGIRRLGDDDVVAQPARARLFVEAALGLDVEAAMRRIGVVMRAPGGS